MSSSESNFSHDSDRDGYKSAERYLAVEVKEDSKTLGACVAERMVDAEDDDFENDEGPNQFDPVAEEAFTAAHRREVAEAREGDCRLTRRFEGIEPLESWYVSFTFLIRFDWVRLQLGPSSSIHSYT